MKLDFSDQAESMDFSNFAELDFSNEAEKMPEMTPTTGFVENLAPNLQEAGRLLEEGFTSDPISAIRSIPAAMKEIGKSAKEGMFGDVVQIATGTAEKERKVQKEALKRVMLDEIKDKIDSLKEGSKEHEKAINEFDTLMGTPSDKIDLTKDTPGFSIEALVDSFKEDKGAFFAEFVNAIAEDPLLAITPLGGEKAAALAAARTAKLSKTAQSAAKITAGATGAAATGAAIGAGISAAEQAATEGDINFKQVVEDALVTGAFSAPFGVAAGLKSVSRQIARITDIQEPVIVKALSTELKNGLSVEEAIIKVTNSFKATGKILEDAPSPKPITKMVDDIISENSVISKGISSQSGKINIGLLTGVAAVTAGATLGFAQDQEFKDAVIGGAAGLGIPLGAFAIRKIGQNIGKLTNDLKDTSINISKFADEAEGVIATSQRASMQLKESIMSVIPDKAAREKIPFFLEGDKTVALTSSERAVAEEIRGFFKDIGKHGVDEEVLGGLLNNYVPHIWQQGIKSSSEIIQSLESRGTGKISPKTPFGKERVIPTLKDGLDLGLVPRTLDIAEIVKIYSDSVNRAIANKKMIAALKDEISPDGLKLILKAEDAPKGYRFIDHPQLNGMKVHPEIEPSMRFMFEASDPGHIFRGLLAVNFAAKRLLVSASFFHANALLESTVFAGGLKTITRQITRNMVERVTGKKINWKVSQKNLDILTPEERVLVLEARKGMNAPIEMLKNGRSGDVVDYALKAGLKIGTIEDVGTDLFYASLKDAQTVANKIPVIGKAPATVIKMYEKANLFVDNIMWDKLATGQKLSIFMKELESEIIKNAKRHKKNPEKFPLEDPRLIANDIAEFVNDAYGGLNWRKMAEGIDNKYFKKVALETFSPRGRKFMQLALFAPDWTLANLRVLGKAIPGVARNKRVAKFHQAYFARASVFAAIVGDGINVMLSGHHLWDNEDPSMIDMGDGRKMQFSKQFIEPFHWATMPVKTARNKMGILPKEAMEQAINVKYLTEGGGPKMEGIGDRATNIAANFVPIWVQQISDQGLDGLAGFLGHPIYGKKEQ